MRTGTNKRARKFVFRTLIVLCLAVIVAIGVIWHEHPILLKWLDGDAWCIGKPVHVTVYIDGRMTNTIKIYQNNRLTNDYLLALPEPDRYGMLKYINIDLDKKWIGRPAATDKDDYDIVNESLYQSDVGAHFADFRDDIKGFNFDPHLYHSGDTIKFNVPPDLLKFNSVMIVLAAQ